MVLLLLVSILGAILLHRKAMNAYAREFLCDDETKVKLPYRISIVLGLFVAIPAVISYIFIRKYPMAGMILIAILTAALAVWICNQIKTKKIQAIIALSLVPAALSVISKAQAADNIKNASALLSILANGLIPIGVCAIVGLIRWLYLAGYFSERLDREEIEDELAKLGKKKPSKSTEIRSQQLNAQLARIDQKASYGEFIKKAKTNFEYGYTEEEPEEPEEPEEEVEEDEYEDIYSDSSLEPSARNANSDKKFYYIVFGVVIIIVVVCLSIVLINL